MSAKPIIMPIAEVCDRYTIALLKLRRLPESEVPKAEAQAQVDYYSAGVDWSYPGLGALVMELQDINGKIWDAEGELRAGHESNLSCEYIAKGAVLVRTLNRERAAVKNKIVELTRTGFKDCKMNYAGA